MVQVLSETSYPKARDDNIGCGPACFHDIGRHKHTIRLHSLRFVPGIGDYRVFKGSKISTRKCTTSGCKGAKGLD